MENNNPKVKVEDNENLYNNYQGSKQCKLCGCIGGGHYLSCPSLCEFIEPKF